jgi:DNA ligase 1
MKEVLEIINQIKTTSSRNEKEAILKQHKDNNDLKNILYFVFNPYITTGLKSKKLNKIKQPKPTKQFNDIQELLEYIKVNNTGTDEVIHNVKGFIRQHDEELQQFYTDIVTKELKIGATETTLNKVFGKDFIPSFGCLLAKNYYDEIHKVKGEFFVTLKLDGHRMLAVKENGSISFFTRQGQSIDGLVDIAEELKQLPDNYVYDGEVLLRNDKGLASKDLYRETTKVTRRDGIKKNLEFHIFDLLPIDEFKQGKSKKIYKDRRAELDGLFEDKQFEWLKKVEVLYHGTDKDKVEEILKQVVADGQEGVMVSLANGYYVTKRSDVLLKVKQFHTVDLRCIGIEEGEGKYKGKLGRINVEYKGNIVGVGSGFTDHDREFYFNNPDEIVGKIVEVQYFEESQNEEGGVSLRFPVFVRVRDDKNEPSYF